MADRPTPDQDPNYYVIVEHAGESVRKMIRPEDLVRVGFAARQVIAAHARRAYDELAYPSVLRRAMTGGGGRSVHVCPRCGSDRWVGWRAGRDPALPRRAQCVPCGNVGDLVGDDE